MHVRVFDENRDPAAAVADPEPLVIARTRLAVTAPIVIKIAAVIPSEQIDPGISSTIDRLDPAVPQSIDGLLQSPTEIAATIAFAARERTVGASVGQNGRGTFQ